jgi:hypothetical protein
MPDSTRTPRTVAQIARETLRELGYGDLTYDFEMVLAALAREGWLAPPGERDAARARVAELEAENQRLRYRIDEMDICAGEVLDSPVIDGRTSVRPEYVAALRATMEKPLAPPED